MHTLLLEKLLILNGNFDTRSIWKVCKVTYLSGQNKKINFGNYCVQNSSVMDGTCKQLNFFSDGYLLILNHKLLNLLIYL